MKFVFIRHAEPIYEKKTLTEHGFIEAEALSKMYSAKDFDEVYCSPLERARMTCDAVIKGEKEVHVCDYLKEFAHMVDYNGEKVLNWDFYPEYFENIKEMYDYDKYLDTEIMRSGDIKKYVEEVYEEFSKILLKHGIIKDGRLFRIKERNDDVVVIFCHLGIMSVLLSYLVNIPYIVFAQHFCSLTTGVCEVVTEERVDSIAQFRILKYGDLSHLKKEEVEESFCGRFCERFDSEDRH